jgi:hypothetical protein
MSLWESLLTALKEHAVDGNYVDAWCSETPLILWTLLHGLRPFYDDHSATAGDYFCDTAWR